MTGKNLDLLRSLTRARLAVLRFVRGYQASHDGLGPHRGEIVAGTGLKKMTVRSSVEWLAAAGLLQLPIERYGKIRVHILKRGADILDEIDE